jgi:glutamate transport system permease protein
MNEIIDLLSKYDVPRAFLVNIELTLWATAFSFVLGLFLVAMRVSPVPSFRFLGTSYVEIFRNAPLTIIMVLFTLGIWAQLKIEFSSNFNTNFFWLAVAGLSLYHAAFMCEALRSGINTVPKGQAEAARSIGLTFSQSMTKIIMPQAIRGSIAPIGNTVIAVLKNSTVAAAASVSVETSSLMTSMIEFDPQHIVAIFMIFALGYIILIIPIGIITTILSDALVVKR